MGLDTKLQVVVNNKERFKAHREVSCVDYVKYMGDCLWGRGKDKGVHC